MGHDSATAGMPGPATETELKFTIDSAAAQRLRSRLTALAAPETQDLASVYFDTPDQRLRQAGVALRLRAVRDGWVQTVKAKSGNATGLQVSHEAECAAPGARIRLKSIPDKALRKSVRALIGKDDLIPVCETRMQRVAAVLRGPGGSAVEVAVDEGQIIAGERSAPYSEAEMELKTGDVAALYDLAGELLPDGGLDFSRMSKSARGYRLAETGTLAPPLAPRNARPVPLVPKMATEDAAQAVMRECFDQVAANAELVRKSDDIEGPHQLRVGLRRLRSAFRLFRPVTRGPQLDALEAEAAWLGRMVGMQRDLDVLGADVILPAKATNDDPEALDLLAAAVAERAAANREALRMILATTRVQRFLLGLGGFIESCGWPRDAKGLRRPVAKRAAQSLDDAWRRAAKAADGIETLDTEDRHTLRKRLKTLRYGIEFTAPLYSEKKVARFVTRLKALQQVFGDLNDLAMAEAMLTGPEAPLARDARIAAAVAQMQAQGAERAARAWDDAQDLWSGLASAPAFWR